MPYDPVFLWATCFLEKMTNFADQAFFQMFRGDLISRMTAKQIFRGSGQNPLNPRNLIPLKYIVFRFYFTYCNN